MVFIVGHYPKGKKQETRKERRKARQDIFTVLKNRDYLQDSEYTEQQNAIPLEDGLELSKNSNLEEIREQYKNAIYPKRDYYLPFENFEYHLEYPETKFFQYKDSYLIGNYNEKLGFFLPSHFAPKSLREGIELLKQIAQYDNIIFAVMEDMTDMLSRIGFQDTGFSVPQYFGGGFHTKYIVVSNKNYVLKNSDKIAAYFGFNSDNYL